MHSAVLNHSVDPIAASQPFADWDVARAAFSGTSPSIVIDSIPDSRGGRTITATGTQRPAYVSSDANFNSKPDDHDHHHHHGHDHHHHDHGPSPIHDVTVTSVSLRVWKRWPRASSSGTRARGTR